MSAQSAYQSSLSYQPGQQVIGENGNVYQALVRVPPVTPPPNSDFWSEVTITTPGGLPSIVDVPDNYVLTVIAGLLAWAAGGGGGLPPWIQFGEGDPLDLAVVPNVVGGLYFDLTGGSGIWTSFAATALDWAMLGGASDDDLETGAGGLEFFPAGPPGQFSSYLVALGEGQQAGLLSGQGALVVYGAFMALATMGQNVNLHVWPGDPNDVIQSQAEGDVLFDTETPAILLAANLGVEAFVTGDGIDLPLVVVEGVNDTFTLTLIESAAHAFVVPPGTYSTMPELCAAIQASNNTFGYQFENFAIATPDGSQVVITLIPSAAFGVFGNGSTITPGDTDISADLGFANPTTFEGGVNTIWNAIGAAGQLGNLTTDLVHADATTTITMDGGDGAVLACLVASPPSWMDDAGNITSPGIYTLFATVGFAVADVTPGLFANLTPNQLTPGGAQPIPLDALLIGGNISPSVTFAIAEADLPFIASWGVFVGADAGSVGQFTVQPGVQRVLAG